MSRQGLAARTEAPNGPPRWDLTPSRTGFDGSCDEFGADPSHSTRVFQQTVSAIYIEVVRKSVESFPSGSMVVLTQSSSPEEAVALLARPRSQR